MVIKQFFVSVNSKITSITSTLKKRFRKYGIALFYFAFLSTLRIMYHFHIEGVTLNANFKTIGYDIGIDHVSINYTGLYWMTSGWKKVFFFVVGFQIVLAFVLHSFTSFCDPGTYVPNHMLNSENNDSINYKNKNNLYKNYEADHVLYCPGQDNTCWFCSKSQEELEHVPFRSKHLYREGRCIQRFDHYCIWHSNAIGSGNLLFFYCFIMCVTLTVSSSVIIAAIMFYNIFKEFHSYIPNEKILKTIVLIGKADGDFPYEIIKFIAHFITASLVGYLTCSQTYQILTNQTTFERMKKRGLILKLNSGQLFYGKQVIDPEELKMAKLLFAEKLKRFENIDPINPIISPCDENGIPYYKNLEETKYYAKCRSKKGYSTEHYRRFDGKIEKNEKYSCLINDESPFVPIIYKFLSVTEAKKKFRVNYYNKGIINNIKDAFGGTKIMRKYKYKLCTIPPKELLIDYIFDYVKNRSSTLNINELNNNSSNLFDVEEIKNSTNNKLD